MLPEFLKHMGPRAVSWLTSFYSRVIIERKVPREWRQAKVIAIPKPGKDPQLASSYRPISLLSVCFKTLERVMLNRVRPTLEEEIVVEQAGFRQGRCTGDQVLALTTFIENGFQTKMKTGVVPREWRQAKVIAIPKPGKDPQLASSYRPISLLSVCFKTLERVMLNRVRPTLEEEIVVEQVGFRQGRCTGDQVLALTTFIENGFQTKMKTGVVFLDLTAAFDTVWHTGLLLKISKVLPWWFTRGIEVFLCNRRFRVHMGNKTSSWRTQKDGLPQGSILSSSLFSVYINDLPDTQSRKFAYVDDIALASQQTTFERIEEDLNMDLGKVSEYLQKWCLIPSTTKTASCVFHLHNAKASRELNIFLNGMRIMHDPKPVYLGVTLDQALTYHDHLKKTAANVNTRNNLLAKLADSTWGANSSTLSAGALLRGRQILCPGVGPFTSYQPS